MNWNILTSFEKVLIINLLPQVRINYKYIEARNLFTPEPKNYSLNSALFGDSKDLMFQFGNVGQCKSQKFKAIHAWDSIAMFRNDLMTADMEYNIIQKRLISMWTVEAISEFYIELAKLYYYQDKYDNKKELKQMVTKILKHIHQELAKFEVDPNTKSLLSYMDITRIYYTNDHTTVCAYDKVIDICVQYGSDWFNIYPFAPRLDRK